MTRIFNKIDALDSLYPTASWSIVDGVLNWSENNFEEKPSENIINTEIIRLQREYDNKEYQRLRAAEYPDFRDFLDAIVKQDTEQMRLYTEKCMQVKMKYPKPGGY